MLNTPTVPQEKRGPISAFFHSHLVSVVGTLLAAVGAYVAYQALLRDKQAFTMERILLVWNDQVSSRKDKIEEQFPGLYNEEKRDVFDEPAAQKLYKLRENGKRYQVRQAMVELLNYMEIVSIAYDSKLVDQEMFRGFASGPMLRWRRVLSPFIRIYNQDRGSCVWKPYEQLMDKWAHERVPRHAFIPKMCDGAP